MKLSVELASSHARCWTGKLMRLLVPTRTSYSSSETSSYAVFSIQSITSSDSDNPSGTLSPIQGASAVGSPATAVT